VLGASLSSSSTRTVHALLEGLSGQCQGPLLVGELGSADVTYM